MPPLPDSTGWGVHVLTVARDPQGGDLGRDLRAGDLPPAAGRHGLGGDPARHDRRTLDLHGLRAGDRLRAAGRDLVRHGRQRLGTLDRRRRHLAQLDLRAARPRVAVRGARRHRRAGRHHDDRHRRRPPADDRRRRALDRHRRRRRPAGQGPGRHRCFPLLSNEYVRRLAPDRRGWNVTTLRGNQRLRHTDAGWEVQPLNAAAFPPANAVLIGRQQFRGTPCGLRPTIDTLPCLRRPAPRRRRARGAAHHLVPPADRADRQPLHRPDLPLRLDHGRLLPAAPGRRVQQPRRHAGHGQRSAARWSTPAARSRGR